MGIITATATFNLTKRKQRIHEKSGSLLILSSKKLTTHFVKRGMTVAKVNLKKKRAICEHLEKLKAKKEYEDVRDFAKGISKKENMLKDHIEKLERVMLIEKELLEKVMMATTRLDNVENEQKLMQDFEKKSMKRQ